jgi:3-oxoacyl-[acyl-carrier protein] reductase
MRDEEYWREQTVLVTGASRGIGRELVRRFAQLGARVAGTYLSSQAQAEALVEECGRERVRLYRADVAQEAQVAAMVAEARKELGPISVLVNNAGQTRDGLLLTMKSADWKDVLATHLDGAFYCTRAVLRDMLARRHGRIVNVTSVSGVKGTAGQSNYSAAKAGLIGLTRALAREMGRKNITVNAVALGVIETDMTAALPEAVLADYKEGTSLKRFGTVGDVADLVEFVAGPRAGYMTGQVLPLDGGLL